MIVALMIIITNSIFSLAKTWRVFRKYARFPASVLEMSLRFSTRPDPGDGRKSNLLLACINHFLLKYIFTIYALVTGNQHLPATFLHTGETWSMGEDFKGIESSPCPKMW